ncbi:MAG: hypothetical protein DRI32_04710 [Chloroflexi bacterium]|nr:MAG: hypothetical protein DRI32_04710 [Chloroflexota bacterium]
MTWFSDPKEGIEIKRLLGMLSNPDLKKRNQAAREFLKLGEKGASALVATLETQDNDLRELVARILIRLGNKALPALHNTLSESSLNKQDEVIEILGEMKGKEVLEVLFQVLKNSEYRQRILAAKMLAKIGDRQATPQLLVALSDSDPDVRIAAVIALGKFRDPETYLNIVDLLSDVEINVRLAAVKVLGEIKAPSTIPYLVDALQDSFWGYDKNNAIQTLVNVIASFGKNALSELSKAMKSKDPNVRRYAISLLRPLREPQMMGALEMAFYDTNYDVAENALAALLEFGEGALPIIAKALVTPNEWLREKSVWGLGEIGGEQATIYLLEMLGDEADSVRKEAISSLKKLKDPHALPTLRAIASARDNREISRLARQAIAAIEAP